MPRHRLTVYLHVGPPKTGTTYLQDVLWRNRALSRSRDVDLPGSRAVDHFHAALDLRGIDFGGQSNPEVTGAWKRLAGQALATDLGKAVISHEIFAGASIAEIDRAVSTLAPATVHVVYGARDLARQLPAVWQESLKNRRTSSFDAFLVSALHGPPPEEVTRGFWRAQDPVTTLKRWATAVPPERIHVVTLPSRGARAETLWERFCSALRLDPRGYDLGVARSNTSLPAEDAEVLRRLNSMLPPELGWSAYERAVKRRFNARALAQPRGSRLLVPDRYRATVNKRAQLTRDSLTSAGYAVHGDLADLVPAAASFGDLPEPAPDRVTDAAVEILAGVLAEAAAAESRDRRARARHSASALRARLRRG